MPGCYVEVIRSSLEPYHTRSLNHIRFAHRLVVVVHIEFCLPWVDILLVV
jgi:hypothetical protein